MNTRVVTIARQVGSGGEEVASAIAKRLGFRLIDYQVIQAAAEEARVFGEAASSLGMQTVTSQTYVEGATFFEPQIMGARDVQNLGAQRILQVRPLTWTGDGWPRVGPPVTVR